jgi:two-component system nitrate/nitrite response regulator NarP
VTRILIADDHPIILSGAEALLRGTRFDIIATFPDGDALLEQLAELGPEMIVLDVQMPRCSGLDVLRALRRRNDDLPVILLTAAIDEREAREAIGLGVNGLVLKDTAPGSLVHCLEEVAQGRRWIEQSILLRALDASLESDEIAPTPLAALSQREREIMNQVVQGLRNREIAALFGITEGTVKVHLHKVYEKLGVSSRTELVILINRMT